MQTTRGASLTDAKKHDETGATSSGGLPDKESAPRRVGVLVSVAVLALVLDVVSKIIVVARLAGREPIELFGGLLTLRVTRNSGAAFSIATGLTVVLTLIAIGVVIAILRTARRLRSLPWAVSLGLLLGGATGNLVDRLLRSPAPLKGHVVDWIELPNWPVFNLADSAIVCGGVLAVLLASRGLQLDGTRVTGSEKPSESPSGNGSEPAPEDGSEPRSETGSEGAGTSRDTGRDTGAGGGADPAPGHRAEGTS
ncbi:signal peptidase II [Actinomadura sp. HBU206391]|uniref:signal peptidase II n=1 Tax=Actinomadura sp. HBU206391 TaxID=2731692 RepID=UPI001650AC8F|nr:signal peptidase II [Actinomadura sp. HBU206391]MBC6462319.1 signal peptidase II [Actinomadura sp. HBU206391]